MTESNVLFDKLHHPALAIVPRRRLGREPNGGDSMDNAAKHVEDVITSCMIGHIPATIENHSSEMFTKKMPLSHVA